MCNGEGLCDDLFCVKVVLNVITRVCVVTLLVMVTDCAVCKDAFKSEDKVYSLPCKHIYHTECIMPWLKRHNTCPVCRYELRTDDPMYEQIRAYRNQQRREEQG